MILTFFRKFLCIIRNIPSLPFKFIKKSITCPGTSLVIVNLVSSEYEVLEYLVSIIAFMLSAMIGLSTSLMAGILTEAIIILFEQFIGKAMELADKLERILDAGTVSQEALTIYHHYLTEYIKIFDRLLWLFNRFSFVLTTSQTPAQATEAMNIFEDLNHWRNILMGLYRRIEGLLGILPINSPLHLTF